MSAGKSYWRLGEPLVWVTGASLAITLLIALTLVVVVAVNGLGVFWPADLYRAELNSGATMLGEIIKREPAPGDRGERIQFKIGNRDSFGLDFRWIDASEIRQLTPDSAAITLERDENGNLYGYLKSLDGGRVVPGMTGSTLAELRAALEGVETAREAVKEIDAELSTLSYRMAEVRNKLLKYRYKGLSDDAPEIAGLLREQTIFQDDFEHLLIRQGELKGILNSAVADFELADGRNQQILLADMVRIYQPNSMGTAAKVGFYFDKLVELFVGQPRESNTEGGLFPAIFGTVLLIFFMSAVSFPFGVVAAIYLREYAKDGVLVRIVRIAVNNLAGIPSIVYGIFGLGFFVYGVGGSIDKLFYPERLPTPTFGTGGILWASLTLALLTVPVVIVSTEEALGAIPRDMREGSYALGSTKFQTLWRILLPMASPGIMTGLILAMARAAGEVAPLMITGVVKLAPALPIDGNFPFVHLDRKFMHLGFHIYDIGFQSPNVEAAKPMVFVTTLLLVLIVLVMSSVAIYLRNRMKKRYTFGTF